MATEQNALQDLLKKNKRIVQYRCNRGRVIHKGTPNSVACGSSFSKNTCVACCPVSGDQCLGSNVSKMPSQRPF